MITNHSQAADEMAARFIEAMTAAGVAWPVEWPNVAFDKPAETATWARWTLDYDRGGQNSLPGVQGRSRFGKSGRIEVGIFTPLGAGTKIAYDAAQVAINAYEGKRTPSDVWFRNVRIDDDGQGRGGDAAWWLTTVVAEFTYDNLN